VYFAEDLNLKMNLIRSFKIYCGTQNTRMHAPTPHLKMGPEKYARRAA